MKSRRVIPVRAASRGTRVRTAAKHCDTATVTSARPSSDDSTRVSLLAHPLHQLAADQATAAARWKLCSAAQGGRGQAHHRGQPDVDAPLPASRPSARTVPVPGRKSPTTKPDSANSTTIAVISAKRTGDPGQQLVHLSSNPFARASQDSPCGSQVTSRTSSARRRSRTSR